MPHIDAIRYGQLLAAEVELAELKACISEAKHRALVRREEAQWDLWSGDLHVNEQERLQLALPLN